MRAKFRTSSFLQLIPSSRPRLAAINLITIKQWLIPPRLAKREQASKKSFIHYSSVFKFRDEKNIEDIPTIDHALIEASSHSLFSRTYLQRVIFHEAHDGLGDVLDEAKGHADAFEKWDDIV